MNKIKSNLKINIFKEGYYDPEKEIIRNKNQKDVNDVKMISNSKTYTYSNKANKSLKQMLLNGDIVSDFDFKKPQRKFQRRIFNNNHASSFSKNFPIKKRLIKNDSKINLSKEYFKDPCEIILNKNTVKELSNFKTDNISNKIYKSQKQMLLNGDIINDFDFKKPQQKIRKCSNICEKFNLNQNILDYVRRSDRLAETLVNDKKEQMIISHILNNREEGIIIIETKEKGRGVESTVCFKKDSFVVEYAGNLISEKEAREKESFYKADPSKGSYMFYFRFKDRKYCVDATEESGKLGRLLNHCKLNPNCYVKAIPVNGLPRLTIFAKRDIEIGEELLYDYGDRDKISLEANPWLKF